MPIMKKKAGMKMVLPITSICSRACVPRSERLAATPARKAPTIGSRWITSASSEHTMMMSSSASICISWLAGYLLIT